MVLRADSIEELDEVALTCRTDRHDWERGKAVEYVWTKTVRGKVVEAERRKVCLSCGTIARTVYAVRAGEFIHKGNAYTYPTDTPYLIKRGTVGGSDGARQALGLLAARLFPDIKFG